MKDILPPNKLTLSERLLCLAFGYLLIDVGLMALGAFLYLPWIVGGIAVICICVEHRR